jgi:hypothetical protein
MHHREAEIDTGCTELTGKMPTHAKIEHKWHDTPAGRYVRMWPRAQPEEHDWIEATKLVFSDYENDHVFMIIDHDRFMPVMTKGGFDRMIRYLQSQGLNGSTVGVVLGDEHYRVVARMFEASTSVLSFDLVMKVFDNVASAEQWLQEIMRRD